jgi:mono/diheme cytochrome c family protein
MTSRSTLKSTLSLIFLAAALLLVTGCDVVPLHMRSQPRYEPLDPSNLWENGMASRPIPANTIPRGEFGLMMLDSEYYTGKISEEEFVQTIPFEVDRETLLRGQDRFDVFCSPCHGVLADGQGMIVERGFKQPSTFHDQRLYDAADGYFYDIIGNGFGVMYGYGSRIQPDDRWAIVAYIRALQFSQNVPLDSLSPEDRANVEAELN